MQSKAIMIAREEEIKVLKKVEVEIVDDIYQMIAKKWNSS